MFIRYMSDLHLEFGKPKYLDPLVPMPEDKDSVLVLAGDIGVGAEGIRWADSLTDRFLAVLYLPGNHEFYGQYWEDLLDELKANAGDVILLDPMAVEYFVVNGVGFIGATLWTDFGNANPNVTYGASRVMNDYRKISTHDRRFTPTDVLERHKEHKKHLFCTLGHLKRDKTVVVSHHLPSFALIHDIYKYEDYNEAYASNLDKELMEVNPMFWFFGHSHVSTNKTLGNTTFLSNAHGYHNVELNPEFDVCARVEIDV